MRLMSRIINKVKQIALDNKDILIVDIFVLLCDLYIKFQCGIQIGKLSLIFNLLYMSIISIIFVLLSKRIRIISEIIFAIIMSIISFSQVMHYKFFGTFYRFKKLKVINELYDVKDEVLTKIDIGSLLIFVLLFALVVLLILVNKNSNSGRKELIVVNICLSLFTSVILIINFNINRNEDDVYLKDTFYNNYKYVNRFGIYDYLFNDFSSLFTNKGELTNEKIDEINKFIENNDNSVNNEYSAIFKGKNLILIECESLNNYPFIDELTPTLTKLSKEGYYFTNFYSPLYGSATSDAEFISLTSMLPSINEGQTCYTYVNNNYKYSLPNLFKTEGYNVNSYHANYERFYNRDIFHKALGFEEFYDIEELGIEQLNDYTEDVNWVPDTLLFDTLLDHTNIDSKFFDFVTTVSGHMPYVDYREEIKDNLAIINSSDKYNYMNDETKAYVACQMSLDQGLEILLNKLEEKNILDKTIIILFGDHYPYGLEDLDAQYTVYGTGIEKYKTPLIIYDPTNKEGKTVDTLVSSFDIYPTICNMFGLDSTGCYKIGKDVFEDNHIIPFLDRSVLTNNFYYDSSIGIIDWYNDENEESLKNIIDIVNDAFEIGELILVYDYYK